VLVCLACSFDGLRKERGQLMQTHSKPDAKDPVGNWEPINDVPYNLDEDGRNYIEWTCSLIDDGIELNDQVSFSTLKTNSGQPLLTDTAAKFLDEQMIIARKAAIGKGHDFADVILCCKAPDVNSGRIADELIQLFFRDTAAVLARAKSLGEICDEAEEFNKDAIFLKFNVASDEGIPKAVRVAFNGPVDVP
jgi:hypothetical protein